MMKKAAYTDVCVYLEYMLICMMFTNALSCIFNIAFTASMYCQLLL